MKRDRGCGIDGIGRGIVAVAVLVAGLVLPAGARAEAAALAGPSGMAASARGRAAAG